MNFETNKLTYEGIRKRYPHTPLPEKIRECNKKENNPNWRGGKYVLCSYCGKLIWRKPSELKTNGYFYCSRKCMGSHRKQLYKGKNNPNWKKPWVIKKCPVCGKKIRTKNKNQICCSKICRYKWVPTKISGEKHFNYGRKLSETLKKKISIGIKKHWEKYYEEMLVKVSRNPNRIKKLSERMKGDKNPSKKIENKIKISESVKNAYLRGCYDIRPTKPEKKIIGLIKKFNLPYKYVGNGTFWVGSPPMNPDFLNINGEKVVIEVLGDYWHTKKEFEERKMRFKEYGFRCIGIWESEINNLSELEIVEKINKV